MYLARAHALHGFVGRFQTESFHRSSDSGLATGSTMIAALHALRAKKPAELICAVPVAPPDTLQRIRSNADRVVCLSAPLNFQAVGQFYQDFPQVSDAEVIAILATAGCDSSADSGPGKA